MDGRFVLDKFANWLSGTVQRLGVHGVSRLGSKLRLVETPEVLAEHRVMKGLTNTSAEANLVRYNFLRPTTRPVTTKYRRLVLAPALTHKEDVVCKILGAKAPLVLRPAGDGTYKIGWEAYVQDIMFGESLVDGRYPKDEVLIRWKMEPMDKLCIRSTGSFMAICL